MRLEAGGAPRQLVERARRIIAPIVDSVQSRLGNKYSPDYYLSLGYILVIALGLHILVTLRYAPEAGIALSRLVGTLGPTPLVAALEILALVAVAKAFADGWNLFPDKRLAFTYSLYQASTTLPYLNLLYIALSSISNGPRGINIRASNLVVALVYLIVSLVIVGIASGSPFAIVEVYRAKRTGAFTREKLRPGDQLVYGEDELIRVVYIGRRDRPATHVLTNSRAWKVRAKSGEGRLEIILQPLEPVEDALSITLGGTTVYTLRLRPAHPVRYAKPDTEIHLEVIMPGEGGKTIRKIIIQRPGGVSLEDVLKDVLPKDTIIQRVLRIEGGQYVPVRDISSERIKPRTLNRFVVETIPAAKPLETQPPKAKPKAPRAEGIPAAGAVDIPTATEAPQRAGLVEKVKRLIEEYRDLREDLW
ncbi:MAG: hypothetical protein F7C34_03455 [Desulfurococcales archaeon]|nr:hypothetical protein [Desulfurococcales archaeon]